MTNRDVAKLGFFLLGVFLLLRHAGTVAASLFLPEGGGDPSGLEEVRRFTLVYSGAILAFALSLVIFAGAWARLVFKESRTFQLTHAASEEMQQFLVGLTGLVLLGFALARIAGVIVELTEAMRTEGVARSYLGRESVQRASSTFLAAERSSLIVRFLFGAWLFFGSRSVVALWNRFGRRSAA